MNTEPNAAFLPDQRPSTLRPKLVRIALLWLFIILVYAGIYIYGMVTRTPVDAPSVALAWAAGGAGLVVAIFIYRVVWLRPQLRRATAMHAESFALLGRGELKKAQALFAEMTHEFRRLSRVRVAAQYNGASARLLDGDLEGATRAFVAIERVNGLARIPALRAQGAAYLALCHALAGTLDHVAPWLDEAEKLRPTTAESLKLTGTLTLVRAIVDCRQGRPSEAARLIEADRRAFEEVGGDVSRALRLVLAFAIAQTGAPHDDDAGDRLLAPLRESRPRSLRYLGVAWPEMAAFIELHQL